MLAEICRKLEIDCAQDPTFCPGTKKVISAACLILGIEQPMSGFPGKISEVHSKMLACEGRLADICEEIGISTPCSVLEQEAAVAKACEFLGIEKPKGGFFDAVFQLHTHVA